MKLRRLILVVTALTMLAASLATSASAADFGVTEAGKEWYANGSKLTEFAAFTCKAAGTFTLTGVIGGESAELTATGAECPGTSLIYNSGEMAVGKGKFKLTGVKLLRPAGCSAPTEITTNELVSQVKMGSVPSSLVFDKFQPAAGETGTFALVKISGLCAAAGTRVLSGWLYGQLSHATGVESKELPLSFGTAANVEVGTGLNFAGNPATLTGNVVITPFVGGVLGVK